ncbi:MAG: TolC family outer membrane protein [Magnetococcales bacterium]|nr:TolC family outer membrane protein [Magnetococcales bacterium]MBF0156068.1 TolC family outer membrane protein [Magnetococcales bacterium]
MKSPWRKGLTWSALLLSPLLWVGECRAGESPLAVALGRALTTSPSLQAAELGYAAKKEQVRQAAAKLFPEVALGGSKSVTGADWEGGGASSDPVAMELSLGQSLYSGPLKRSLDYYRLLASAAEEEVASARQAVLLKAAGAAVATLEAREVLRLAGSYLEVTERHLVATQARFRVGEVTRTDVSQAESRLAAARAQRIGAENALAVSRAAFEEVVGAPAAADLALPAAPVAAVGEKLTELKARVDGRPDLRAAKASLEAGRMKVALAEAGHEPVLSLSSTLGRSWETQVVGRVDPVDSYNMTLALSVPIYSGGGTTAAVAQAVAERDALGANLEDLRRQALLEVEKAFLDLSGARARMEANQSSVTSATQARDGVEREYQVGTRTSLDLLDAQHELFSAETELARSRFAAALARFQLLHASGRGTVEEMTRN